MRVLQGLDTVLHSAIRAGAEQLKVHLLALNISRHISA
jgi:hypothetical protein